MPELSIVIPAFNEELRIQPTLERLHQFLSTRPMSYELIVVDDGSRDGTVALVETLSRSIPQLRVIATSPNRGKGHAVRVGMRAARGAVRVMCDADGSMPPEELPKLLAPLVRGDVEIAIGSRYADGAAAQTTQPLYRRLWSRLCNRVVQRTLVPGIRDTQCGFKAFSGAAADDLFARAPSLLRPRRGRGRLDRRPPLARQPVEGHVEGHPRGGDHPPQPEPRRVRPACADLSHALLLAGSPPERPR